MKTNDLEQKIEVKRQQVEELKSVSSGENALEEISLLQEEIKLHLEELSAAKIEAEVAAIDKAVPLGEVIERAVKGEQSEADIKNLENASQELSEEFNELEGHEGDPFDEVLKKKIDPMLEILCPEGEDVVAYREKVVVELFSDVETIQRNSNQLYQGPDKMVSEAESLLVARLGSLVRDSIKDAEKSKDQKLQDELLVSKSLAALLISGEGYPPDLQEYSHVIRNARQEANSLVKEDIKKHLTKHDKERVGIILDNLNKSGDKLASGKKESLLYATLPRVNDSFNYRVEVVEATLRGEIPYRVFLPYKNSLEKDPIFKDLIPSSHYERTLIGRLNRNKDLFATDTTLETSDKEIIDEASRKTDDHEKESFLANLTDEQVSRVAKVIKEKQKESYFTIDNHSQEALFDTFDVADFDELLEKRGVGLNAIAPSKIPLHKDDIKEYFRNLWKDNYESLTFYDSRTGNSGWQEFNHVVPCFSVEDLKDLLSKDVTISTKLIPSQKVEELLNEKNTDPKITEKIKEGLKESFLQELSRDYQVQIWGTDRTLIENGTFPKDILESEEVQQKMAQGIKTALIKQEVRETIKLLELLPIKQEYLQTSDLEVTATSVLKKKLEWTTTSLDHCSSHYLDEIFKEADQMTQWINVQEQFFHTKQVIQEIGANDTESIKDLRRELIQRVAKAEDPVGAYKKLEVLIKESESNTELTANREFKLAFLSKFENGGTKEEKDRFVTDIKEDVARLVEVQPSQLSGDGESYRLSLSQVYPSRNYDTYKSLKSYEDRTKDLDKYAFDRNGYDIKIDGILGYRLKPEATQNVQLLEDFSKRVENLQNIASGEKLEKFLVGNLEDSRAKTVEGKILEYFNQKGYSLDTMDVLLGYQLKGQYDQFVAGSVDRVNQSEDQASKEFAMLDELVNRYGDSMKETIKTVQENVLQGPDKELFVTNVAGGYEKTYHQLADSIKTDLEKIPRDKITDDALQKKVAKTIKNTFQNVKNFQERSKYFSEMFSVNDLDNFEEVWKSRTDQLFGVSDAYSIDMKKIEKLQSSTYANLQEEVSKYEEIREVDNSAERQGEVKSSKTRLIKGYFAKNKETAHARMVGDICLASDPNMLRNEKYFEFVLFDQERQKCMGTTMLLDMPEEDGKRYLLYCPNPSVGLVSEVSAKKLYSMMTDRIKNFASENNFDAVLVDKKHGSSTNRAGLFQTSLDQSCLKDASGSEMKISLDKQHNLGGGYNYKDNLQFVWKK